MSWKSHIQGFRSFLQLERSLSINSVEAYERDVEKLTRYLELNNIQKPASKLATKDIRNFMQWIASLGLSARSQSRILSGIKAFYKYLILEGNLKNNPADLVEAPKIGKKLPDTLSKTEIIELIESVDLSHPQGERNRAMLEVLYGCGLRVSELINLKLSDWHKNEGFVRIIGKGNKERLAPIGGIAENHLNTYIKQIRSCQAKAKGHEDFIFLNRNGRKLSRVMIFYIIKELAKKMNLNKKISPHTFRHSFATHLIDGGADLRAVQEMLGHESITTTEIYTHLDRDYLRDAIITFHPRS
ncbi:MAG: tyrosine recombinase XerD [Flavobacteriales bacterium]|nr:tyrosine recombinase XerD [Flavobacteriales bacterium]